MLTLKEAEKALEEGRPFNAGNLYAVGIHDPLNSELLYTVFSYAEPIARIIVSPTRPSVWITDRKFSQTTSKHTNIVRRAWAERLADD